VSKPIFLTLALALAALALAGPAAGAPASTRLSAQGWQTYRAFEGLDVVAVDVDHPRRAHAALQRLATQCARLPGRGAQSSRIRTICTATMHAIDRGALVEICADEAGGGDQATGLCMLAALPAMNRDFGSGARASGAVAVTLAPGRCQAAFAGQGASWSEASRSGDAFLRALGGTDAAAVDEAGTRWQAALARAFKRPLGVGDRGCRPTARH
jgi:hypothetical protein